MLTQPTAETLCQTMGATLTGYQNDNERVTTANEALKKLVAAGQSTIAGKPISQFCNFSIIMFIYVAWSDKCTSMQIPKLWTL